MRRRAAGARFVVADVPGLIEGAHEGVGLGVRFLKHIERTRLVAHLVDTSDASENDPINEFEIIENELRAFSEEVAEKPVIVVATKLDATTIAPSLKSSKPTPKSADFRSSPSRRPGRRSSKASSRHGRCA